MVSKNSAIYHRINDLIKHTREIKNSHLEDCICSINHYIYNLEKKTEQFEDLIEWFVSNANLEYLYEKVDGEFHLIIREQSNNSEYQLDEYTDEYFWNKTCEDWWKEK